MRYKLYQLNSHALVHICDISALPTFGVVIWSNPLCLKEIDRSDLSIQMYGIKLYLVGISIISGAVKLNFILKSASKFLDIAVTFLILSNLISSP